MSAQCEVTGKQIAGSPIRFFERYLTVWVMLCIVTGIVLGQLFPAAFQALGRMAYAQVNLPVLWSSTTMETSTHRMKVGCSMKWGTRHSALATCTRIPTRKSSRMKRC